MYLYLLCFAFVIAIDGIRKLYEENFNNARKNVGNC